MKHLFSSFLLISSLASQSLYADSHFSLTSPDIADGQALKSEQVFKGFGCDGGNTSPALQWQNEPKSTKSFAVTVYDPDAPTGSGWWHWLIYNIPANIHALEKDAGDLKEGHAPEGSVQNTTDFGSKGFGGACPPKGSEAHHYHFKVYALDTEKIELPKNATAAMLGFNLNAHKLAEAEIIATYQR